MGRQAPAILSVRGCERAHPPHQAMVAAVGVGIAPCEAIGLKKAKVAIARKMAVFRGPEAVGSVGALADDALHS